MNGIPRKDGRDPNRLRDTLGGVERSSKHDHVGNLPCFTGYAKG
jgi:hypothetical protein